MEKKQIEQEWNKLCCYLMPIKSRIYNDNELNQVMITTTLCRPCPVTNRKVYYEVCVSIDPKTNHLTGSSRVERPPPSLNAYANEDSRTAEVIHNSETKGDVIQIWDENLEDIIDLTGNKIHGRILDEEFFSSMVWSAHNDHLYYIAESYNENEHKNEFKDDFGDGYSNIFSPAVYSLNLTSKEPKPLIQLPDRYFPLKIFIKNKDIYILALTYDHFKRGIKYCSEYPSVLLRYPDGGSKYEQISKPDRSVFSVSFHPSCHLAAMLDRPTGGPHMSAFDLKIINLKNLEIKTIKSNIFAKPLIEKCWLRFGDEPAIAVNVFNGQSCSNDIKIYYIKKKEWVVYDVDTQYDFDYNLLSTMTFNKGKDFIHYLVASKSNISNPWSIVVLKINFVSELSTPLIIGEEIIIYKNENVSSFKFDSTLKTFYFDDERQISTSEKCAFSAFLAKNEDKKSVKEMIVISHGGPHWAFTNQFNLTCYSLLKQGFSLYFVNYRGSIGFTEKSLESIVGNVGNIEILDVHSTAMLVCKQEDIDPKNVHCMGGSYGGFITAHLIAKYPGIYKSGILMNPVINFESFYTYSDISEYAFALVTPNVPFDINPSSDTRKIMYNVSPINFSKQIKCPVLLFLGENDKRVPMKQGLELYRAIKTINGDIRVFVFPDDHSLLKAESQHGLTTQILAFLTNKLIINEA